MNDMFTFWAEYALKRTGLVEESRKFRNLQEVNMIFGRAALENAANWKNVYIQEGRKEGREQDIEEGEKRGEKKGMAKILLAMLEERFGAIPDTINSFIVSSDSDSLMSFFHFANKVLKRAVLIEESRNFRNLPENILARDTLKNAAYWKYEYILEGWIEGWKKGLKEGWGIGIQCIIEDRFGTIPDSVISYIEAADVASLRALLHFAIRAESLQAITAYINNKIDTADSLEESCHSDRDV